MGDQKLSILVVDDKVTNVKILFELLQQTGFRVLVAKSGETALENLCLVKPDLILLDVMMPGMDGFEVCRRLKAAEATKEIPVIFMTALSDTADLVKGLRLGAVDYITKPFQQEEVLARINVHLNLRQLNKELEQRVLDRTQELSIALEQLKQFQLQLVQNEKMSTLGNLVAGIAHEINNPIGFLTGNLQPAEDYVQDLLGLIDLYQQECPRTSHTIQTEIEAIDLDYLREDLPKLLNSMKEGVARIQNISTSLRTFSRADQTEQVPFNIHEGLDSTLLILKHRLKGKGNQPVIEITKNYGKLPQIECFPGQLCQVFMNLLANAIDAINEKAASYDRPTEFTPTIQIQTQVIHSSIKICITDNGIGMAEDVKTKVFDQMFTTKAVGKGTGLGLAISRQIIVEKHGGTIEHQSAPGQGTEFIITLPIEGVIDEAGIWKSFAALN